MPTLHPPSSTARVEVRDTSVDRYLSQGWRKADVSPPAKLAVAPPKAGPGSSRKSWAEHAKSLGIDVDPALSRDRIIELVEG